MAPGQSLVHANAAIQPANGKVGRDWLSETSDRKDRTITDRSCHEENQNGEQETARVSYALTFAMQTHRYPKYRTTEVKLSNDNRDAQYQIPYTKTQKALPPPIRNDRQCQRYSSAQRIKSGCQHNPKTSSNSHVPRIVTVAVVKPTTMKVRKRKPKA